MTDAVAQVFTELRSSLERACEHDATGELFSGLREQLRNCPDPQTVEVSHHRVIDEWLDIAVDAAPSSQSSLAEKLRAATPELPWLTSYENLEPSPGLSAFQPHYSYQLLVGPKFRGQEPPIRCENVLVGFTLQAPNILYPPHHHAPPEIYGVISGTLDWQVGDDWSTKGPGDVIVHRPHESHAMRTRDEPALCWVAWPHGSSEHVYMPSLDPPDARMEPISY